MKKKQVFTILMVAVILLIAAAGVWIVGSVKGWFDRNDGDMAAVSQGKGIVTMYRDGFAYTPGDGTLLRSGDRLATGTGANASVRVGDGYLVLEENTAVRILW